MDPLQGGCWDRSLDGPWVPGWAEWMDSSSAVFCVLQPRAEQANSSKGTAKAPQQGRPPQAQPPPGPGPAGEPAFGHPWLSPRVPGLPSSYADWDPELPHTACCHWFLRSAQCSTAGVPSRNEPGVRISQWVTSTGDLGPRQLRMESLEGAGEHSATT